MYRKKDAALGARGRAPVDRNACAFLQALARWSSGGHERGTRQIRGLIGRGPIRLRSTLSQNRCCPHFSFRRTAEIFDDNVQVEWRGGPAVQGGIDDPPANFDS